MSVDALNPQQHPSPQPGADRGRGDADRQPGLAVLESRRNLLEREDDEEPRPDQARQRSFDRVMMRAFVVKGASICFILGATMVIKFLAIAEQGMAFRHGHMSVRSNPSLSKLRAVCHSQACQQYTSELQSSLDVHVNPCHSLYGFVCGRWRRGGAVMSTRKAAEARLLRQALQSVMAVNVSEVESSASSTAEKVAALVHSCMYARRHPAELAAFLRARRILPYRQRKAGDLLGILVDLSVNWDIHIWFQMRIVLRSRNTSAVHIGRSQSLADWAAMVKGIRNTRKYNRGIEKVLGLLDLPREQQRETLSRVMALENLISAALGNSPVNEEPLLDRLETMAALLTPSIHATSWLDALRFVHHPVVNITLNMPARVDHPSALRALSHLLDLGPRMQDAVAEHIVYRTILEVGWMVDDRNRRHQRLDSKPDTAAVKCLHHVKNMVGLAWFSLFPASNGDRRVKLSVLGSLRPTLQLLTGIAAPSESSIPADVLPPLQASFFANWVTYKQARLELLSRGLYNVLGVDGVADGSWNQELNSTAEPLIFSYPFFHSDLHPIVNYAGAGRLLARSVLGLTMSNAFLSLEAAAVKAARHALEESGETRTGPNAAFLNSTSVNELFFVASCYSVCSADDARQTARKICDDAIMKLQSFRDAFKCSLPPGRIRRKD